MLGNKGELSLQQRIELYRNGSLFGFGLSLGLIFHSRFLGIVALLATIFCFGVYNAIKDDAEGENGLTAEDLDNLTKEEVTTAKKTSKS
jgi:hypothetical protein